MELPAWMRWVAGWVTASIGCWMKKTIGGNRPNLRPAGTVHARHRVRLFLRDLKLPGLCLPGRRLPVGWSVQCLLGASVPSRPSRDGSPYSHHRQRWSRHHRHQACSPIRLRWMRMTPGQTMTASAWIAGSDRGTAHPVHSQLIHHQLIHRQRSHRAQPPGDPCHVPVVVASDRLSAQSPDCSTPRTVPRFGSTGAMA